MWKVLQLLGTYTYVLQKRNSACIYIHTKVQTRIGRVKDVGDCRILFAGVFISSFIMFQVCFGGGNG